MTRAAARTVGVTLAALATAAALSGCEPQATSAQIRSEARSQSTLSTGPSGPTEIGQTGPAAGATPARPAGRRRGRRGPPRRIVRSGTRCERRSS
jgi:hypothetical protein